MNDGTGMKLLVVVASACAVARARDRDDPKLMNDHFANMTAQFVQDRFQLFSSMRPDWMLGAGQTVAIVDIGLPKNDSFFWCARIRAEDNKSIPKVLVEVDSMKAGAPTTRHLPDRLDGDKCTDDHFFQRPMIANHLTKSIIYGYYAPSAELDSRRVVAPHTPDGMAVARGAQIVSIAFRKRLYVHDSEKHHVRSREAIDEPSALTFLESLTRASTWLVLNAKTYNVRSVQISAVDGTGVEPEWYGRLSPVAYERWSLNLNYLKKEGVWASAPSGNQDVKNESAVYNWPANDPNVVGVGCYSMTRVSIVRQRGPGLDILAPSLEGHPPTSYCNTIAVAVSVAVRDLCLHNPFFSSRQKRHRYCSSSFILFAMQFTGIVHKDPRSSMQFYVIDPPKLFAYVNSTEACVDASELYRKSNVTLAKKLPFVTKYFRPFRRFSPEPTTTPDGDVVQDDDDDRVVVNQNDLLRRIRRR